MTEIGIQGLALVELHPEGAVCDQCKDCHVVVAPSLEVTNEFE